MRALHSAPRYHLNTKHPSLSFSHHGTALARLKREMTRVLFTFFYFFFNIRLLTVWSSHYRNNNNKKLYLLFSLWRQLETVKIVGWPATFDVEMREEKETRFSGLLFHFILQPFHVCVCASLLFPFLSCSCLVVYSMCSMCLPRERERMCTCSLVGLRLVPPLLLLLLILLCSEFGEHNIADYSSALADVGSWPFLSSFIYCARTHMDNNAQQQWSLSTI